MDIFEVIKGRRSIRKFKPDPISEDSLRAILEAARAAPSWANTQCCRLIVVRDPDTRQKLAETVTSVNPPVPNRGTEAVRVAPVVIVACAEPGRSGAYTGGEKQWTPGTDKGIYWYMFDVGLAMQNITLAAHALGLGTVHIGMIDAPAAARVLGLPQGMAVVELMPLGVPDESPPPRPRKELRELVYWEGWGNPGGPALQPR